MRGEKNDINAFAAKEDRSATVMVWNYHDNNDLTIEDAAVAVKMSGLPTGKVLLRHYRIDSHHSNSYEVWKKMGSPKNPDKEQIETLEKAGQLQLISSPEWILVKNGIIKLNMQLPAQGISFYQLTW